jgi:hypothetical protein
MLLVLTTALGIVLTIADAPQASPAAIPAAQAPSLPASRCDREARALVGQTPVRIGKKITAPRKTHDAKVDWPVDTEHRTIGGVWVGEALIEADGTIRHVWTLRDFTATPPWPEINQAIVAAIRKWKFTRTEVNGQAVPVCMPITVNVNFQ